MSTWEVAFRVKYDYPFIRLSEKYSGSKISMWCVWDREMLNVPINSEFLMSEIEDYAKEIGREIDTFKKTGDGLNITLKCTCDLLNSVWNVASRNHCISIDPAVYLDGWGYFRVISFSEDDIKSLFSELSDMGDAELVSKRILHIDAIPSAVWIESFFSRLTDRQMEAITKAYDYGYYASPRSITTDSIASSIGISRSTYEEHLRKAENRIMEAMIPYLKLFRAGVKKREEMISPRLTVPSTGDSNS